MNKIATVIVTYNRLNMLKINIESLLKQTRKIDKIFIIDNASSDGTKEYMLHLKEAYNNIEYIRLEKNVGGSGGFKTGIEIAFKSGYDFIWGMDDDAFPEINALEILEETFLSIGENCCLWSNCDKDDFDYLIKKVNEWMFVGFFIPKEIISKVGLPRDDFFIYHDDSEYSYRIIKNGFTIYKVRDSLINHGNLTDREFYRANFLGRKIMYPKLPDWKLYYFIRNNILKYKFNDINKYKIMLIYLPKDLVKIFIVSRSQFKIAFKGYLHGLIGIKGDKVRP